MKGVIRRYRTQAQGHLVPPADLEDGLEESFLVLECPALHQLLPVRCSCAIDEKSRLWEAPFMRRAVYEMRRLREELFMGSAVQKGR